MGLLFAVRVEGAENVPAEGPAIIAANHRSFFDSPVLMAMCPRPVTFLGKAEYMDQIVTRHLFPAFGMVPIRREDRAASNAALLTAASLLDAGQLIGIYPEGTRSRDGALHRGRTGVAHLAMMTGAPVVPVALRGTERIQPVGARIPRPQRVAVNVSFGEPIRPENYRGGGSRTQRRLFVDDIMHAIAAMSDQERSDEYSSNEPPLIRGGSESVYRVTTHRSDGLSWRHAAERIVDDACRRYDDARVGEVRSLRCRVAGDGRLHFETELSVSTRFQGGTT